VQAAPQWAPVLTTQPTHANAATSSLQGRRAQKAHVPRCKSDAVLRSAQNRSTLLAAAHTHSHVTLCRRTLQAAGVGPTTLWQHCTGLGSCKAAVCTQEALVIAAVPVSQVSHWGGARKALVLGRQPTMTGVAQDWPVAAAVHDRSRGCC
jgi:hypothetical protein